ncbi:MAG: hypothetical protein JSS02_01205 [Planctomycetes bacterium]|nr:hypothetical protein [Planctomycetota bacterium]
MSLHSQHGTACIEPVADRTGKHLATMCTVAVSAPTSYGFTGIDFQLDYNDGHNAGTVLFFDGHDCGPNQRIGTAQRSEAN